MRKRNFAREIFRHDQTGENIITGLASRGRERAALRVQSLHCDFVRLCAICLRDARRNSMFSKAAPTRVNAITRGRTRLRRCLHFG